MTIGAIGMAAGFILILIGIWGFLNRKNIIGIILAFPVFDTGLNTVIVAIGWMRGRTAPIIDSTVNASDTLSKIVDPVPQALVLTAIVIGVGVTALLLAYAIRIHEKRGTLEIDKLEDIKW